MILLFFLFLVLLAFRFRNAYAGSTLELSGVGLEMLDRSCSRHRSCKQFQSAYSMIVGDDDLLR